MKAALTDYRNAMAYNPYEYEIPICIWRKLWLPPGAAMKRDRYLLNCCPNLREAGKSIWSSRASLRKNKSMANAMRYYQGAIYGEWDRRSDCMRWEVRKELCEYLLNRARHETGSS